jgi:hypothetical protein
MRLELTMFMLPMSSTISESLPHSSKAHCSNVPHPEDTAAILQIDVRLGLAGSPHALQDPDITRVGTPCIFLSHSLSTTNRHTSFATLNLAKIYLIPLYIVSKLPFRSLIF